MRVMRGAGNDGATSPQGAETFLQVLYSETKPAVAALDEENRAGNPPPERPRLRHVKWLR